MQDYGYSAIGILAAFIHLIVNGSTMLHREGKGKAYKSYRYLMISIFIYYITDAFWGIFAGMNAIPELFVDTTVYYVAMSSIIVSWSFYIVNYLDRTDFFALFFRRAGMIFFAFEIVSLTVNFFYPCFFWFDANDAYQAGFIRYLALYIQDGLFLLSVILTGRIALRSEGQMRIRCFAIFGFSLVMLFAIIFQTAYPLLPLYAAGCLVGTSLLNTFVIEDERAAFRMQLQEALDMAQSANRAKTTFLNSMSHDIRTPMNAIVGFTGLASKHIDDKAAVSDYLGKIEQSGEHLMSLINDVLDMSRIESGKMTLNETPESLKRIIEGLENIVQADVAARQHRFTVDMSRLSDAYVVCDKLRLNQVLLNILSNAIKYTPNGGEISMCVAETARPDTNGRAHYEFRIKDNGIGMSGEFARTIFDPFTREKTSTVSGIQGTGLGMSITKSIVDMMDGEIAVDSTYGKGSEFVVKLAFRLCARAEVSGEADREAETAEADFTGKRILLVEDNELNREIASEILQEAGFEIEEAEDGSIAVEKVRTGGSYDLVLMDIQMPMMDGYEATHAIRALPDRRRAQIPIVAMTANAFEEDRQKAFDAGMNGHIAKPIELEKLFDTLRKILM